MNTVQRVQRAYNREFAVAMIGYVVVLFATTYIRNLNVGPVWGTVLAVLPVVPIAFAVRAFVRYLRGTDELQRQIQLESLAIAFGGTALVAITYGLLEYAGFPHINPIWLYALMMTLWGITAAVTSRRYR